MLFLAFRGHDPMQPAVALKDGASRVTAGALCKNQAGL